MSSTTTKPTIVSRMDGVVGEVGVVGDVGVVGVVGVVGDVGVVSEVGEVGLIGVVSIVGKLFCLRWSNINFIPIIIKVNPKDTLTVDTNGKALISAVYTMVHI